MFGVSGLRAEQLRRRGVSGLRLGLAYGTWSAVWIVAHGVGGAFTGVALGAIGGVVLAGRGAAPGLLAVLLALGGLHHLGVLRLPMPQVHRQVPRHWMARWPPMWTAAGYGVQLGSAVATRITNFATYAALAAALLMGSPTRGGAIMAAFGLARAVPAAVVGPFAATPARSFEVALRVGEWEYHVHRASGGVLLVAAAVLSAAAWRWLSQ